MDVFYPPGTAAGDWLEIYARAFDTVEVDSTFYGPPPRGRYRAWAARTPDGFVFTLKMPGGVTHEGRLRDPRPALRFCDDARGLGTKLGAILIQLPPDFGPANFRATAEFLGALPGDLPFAIEFRDRRWLGPETMTLLAETGTALALSMGPWLDEAAARSVAADVPGTALYLRWMGAPGGAGPSMVRARDREIEAWARRIRGLDVDRVFAFFSNDYQGHSPASARRLQRLLGQDPVPPERLSPQRELFG